MITRGLRTAVAVMLLVGCIGTIYAGTTTLGKLTVTGTTLDGWKVVCSGSACGNLISNNTVRFNTNQPEMGEGGGGRELGLMKDQFCAELAKSKPSGCNLSSPPASPDITIPGVAVWQPTGCGLGGWKDALLSRVAQFAAGNNYSGDLDAPREGVSFLSACNEHDRCYAVAGGKSECDQSFKANMLALCGADDLCGGWADLYSGIVKTTESAQGAYNASATDRTCALFAKDMRRNGCKA